MGKMLDYLKFERFCVEELRSWGSQPLKVLADAMIAKDGFDERSRNDHWALCELLVEKVHELDETFGRFIKEESEVLKAKRAAVA